ncbi:MAG TPA: hypothetical protein VLT87_18760 [Thermoanaerobaculia bacterium]|nr:hypothetical protein [Thermoanaerobaculia bacterium]
MYRILARRGTAAALVLLAMLWLAAGPAVAAPAVFDPSVPGGSLLASLWSWVTGSWTAASPGPSVEKTALGEDPDSGTTTLDDPESDKGVLIDPNGQH